MRKRIMLVDASPRVNGNSEVIIDVLAADLQAVAEVNVVKMRQKKMNTCLACAACQNKAIPQCVQKDDLSAMTDALEVCDAIVLATPIYFHQVSAQAKLFIDRLYCFFDAAKPNMSKSAKRGKKAVLICSFWGGPEQTYADYAADTVKSFMVMGADEFKSQVFGGLAKPGDIKTNDSYLQKVHEIATWLQQ